MALSLQEYLTGKTDVTIRPFAIGRRMQAELTHMLLSAIVAFRKYSNENE
jgi:hypothetical protein